MLQDVLLQHSLCDLVRSWSSGGRYGGLLGLGSVWSGRHYYGGYIVSPVSVVQQHNDVCLCMLQCDSVCTCAMRGSVARGDTITASYHHGLLCHWIYQG